MHECEICGGIQSVHKHHIFFGTGYRKWSEKYKMYTYLCQYHHQDSKQGIHFNRKFDLEVSKRYRDIFILKWGENEFERVFGANFNIKLVKGEMNG